MTTALNLRLAALLALAAGGAEVGAKAETSPARVACAEPGTAGPWLARDCATIAALSDRDRNPTEQDWAELIAVLRPDSAARGAEIFSAAGGEVRFSDSKVGYVRVRIPVNAIARLERRPEIEMLELVERPDRQALQTRQAAAEAVRDEIATGQRPAHPRAANSGSATPFMPLVDAGLRTRRSDDGAVLDGRGSVIAIVDTFLDPGHAELRFALDQRGGRVPKVVGMLTATDPRDPANPYWVRFEAPFMATASEWRGHILPAPGRYRFGRFVFCAASAETCPIYPMLWHPADGRVWIDGDRDNSFADERPIRDFRDTEDLAGLVTSSRDSPVRVAIQTDAARGAIHVHMVEAAHGTMVASTAAGNRFAGGLFDGVAPGARLLSVGIGDPGVFITIGNKIEGVLLAARHPEVDVINCSIVFGRSDVSTSPIAQAVLARIAEAYGKLVISGQADAGPSVLSVGMLVSRAAFARNLQMFGEARDHVLEVPRPSRRDGRLFPDMVAPSSSLAATADFRLPPAPARDAALGLPPGYTIGGGPSQAAPMVSGAAALLASAARQLRRPADAHSLIAALRTGRRWIADFGVGALDVDRAWRAMRQSAGRPMASMSFRSARESADRFATEPEAIVVAPWHPNMDAARTIAVRQLTGPAGDRRYPVRWLGNDGSFATAETVVLASGVAADLPVSIRPQACGAARAILQILDPENGSVAGETSAYLVVPLGTAPCRRSERFTLTDHDQHSTFFHVEAGETVRASIEIETGIALQLELPAGGIHRLQGGGGETEDLRWSTSTTGIVTRVEIELRKPGLWRLGSLRDPYPQLHAPPHTHRAPTFRRASVTLIGADPQSR